MRIKLVILFIINNIIVFAQEKNDYSPKFSGYVRAWHQTEFNSYRQDQGQFLIKQARIAITGAVNAYASYKFQVDFTRLGKLNTTTTTMQNQQVLTAASASFSDILLDAQAIITPIKDFDISAGQFKVPFGTDNLRADQNADFANRPLLTGVSPSIRDIGLMFSYKFSAPFKAELHTGTFNGAGLNKIENNKTMDYVVRAVISPVSNLNLSGNYYIGKQSVHSDPNSEVQFYNFGADYKLSNLFLDAEYGNKKANMDITVDKTHYYTDKTFKSFTGASFFAYATYRIPTGKEIIKDIIPAIRYEKYNPNTYFIEEEIEVVTMGLTFQFAKISYAHLRINYEIFNTFEKRLHPDKLILELQTRF